MALFALDKHSDGESWMTAEIELCELCNVLDYNNYAINSITIIIMLYMVHMDRTQRHTHFCRTDFLGYLSPSKK